MCPRKRSISTLKLYHVYSRGINKDPIFASDKEKFFYMECLREALENSTVKLYAYCIMSNHVHLILYGDLEDIGELMQQTQGKYGTTYNFFHNRTGHVFQGHFKSKPVNSEGYFWAVIRYIHQNPVKANLVTSVERYRFSSFMEFRSYNKDKSMINIDSVKLVIRKFGNFKAFLEFHSEEDFLLYDDIEEEMLEQEKYRIAHAQRRALEEFGLQSLQDLSWNKAGRAEMIELLKNEYHFTVSQICEMTGLTRYRVIKSLGKE